MIHYLRNVFILLTCCTFLMSVAGAESPTATRTEDDYTRGTQALDQQRWQDAILSFDRVIEVKAKKADAALYWKAYALNKLGRAPLVSATCMQLQTIYASSSWNKDCAALTVTESAGDDAEVHPGRRRDQAAASDDDLKALSLNSLLNRDPAQAIPIIRGIFTSGSSPRLQERVLGLLAQNPSPEAQAAVRDIATGRLAPNLQKRAIQMMGVCQGKRGNETLAEVYSATTDTGIKHAVISAYFISGDASRLVELGRKEKDLHLKRYIVTQLALMDDKAATDYMLELLK
jgi:hypothetical protein